MRVAFWGLVALDLLGILLLFVLGLAAAGSSRTNPVQVALLLFVLPSIPLAAAIVLFLRSSSPVGRAIALLMAATPLVVLVSTRAVAEAQFRAATNDEGEMTFFRAGPTREIVEAIGRNDAETVAVLAPKVDVNDEGMAGMTLLVLALRQLRTTPAQHDVLRALLAAGARPDKEAQYELPLAIAIQVSGTAGVEPVRMLLDAGASPNQRTSFDEPAYFAATGVSASPEAMTLLIEHGADVNATGRNGATALLSAANTRNWKAALVLLQHGADWRLGTSVNGQSFKDLVESRADAERGDSTYQNVRRQLQ